MPPTPMCSTGLRNRRFFNELAHAELERSIRDHGSLWLLMIDIDHFKNINDTLGHTEGDRVLRQVSQALRRFAAQLRHDSALRRRRILRIVVQCRRSRSTGNRPAPAAIGRRFAHRPAARPSGDGFHRCRVSERGGSQSGRFAQAGRPCSVRSQEQRTQPHRWIFRRLAGGRHHFGHERRLRRDINRGELSKGVSRINGRRSLPKYMSSPLTNTVGEPANRRVASIRRCWS